MNDRAACNLRRPLALWNLILAIFSTVGFVVMILPILEQLRETGYASTVCDSPLMHQPWLSFWAFLFVLSKLVEFGDTIFIILRKTPLNFLHWYHHITVLLYSWYALATRNTAGHWFCSLNMGVHSVMYSYYTFKALGFHVSSSIAKGITILQLSQFVVGLVVLLSGVFFKLMGEECGVTGTHIIAGVLMYGSYFLLFLHFFYQRYVVQPKKIKAP